MKFDQTGIIRSFTRSFFNIEPGETHLPSQLSSKLTRQSVSHLLLHLLHSSCLGLLLKHTLNLIECLLHGVNPVVHLLMQLLKHLVHLAVDLLAHILQVVHDPVLLLSHDLDATDPLPIVLLIARGCGLNESVHVLRLSLQEGPSEDLLREEHLQLPKVVDHLALGLQVCGSLAGLHAIVLVGDN